MWSSHKKRGLRFRVGLGFASIQGIGHEIDDLADVRRRQFRFGVGALDASAASEVRGDHRTILAQVQDSRLNPVSKLKGKFAKRIEQFEPLTFISNVSGERFVAGFTRCIQCQRGQARIFIRG